MLSIDYVKLTFADVKDPGVLFKEAANRTEALKLKSAWEAMKTVFNVNVNVKLQVAEGSSVYKFIVLSPDFKKIPVGVIFVIPGQKRVDVWSVGDNLPLIQFKSRAAVFKNYPAILDMAGLDKLFERLVTTL